MSAQPDESGLPRDYSIDEVKAALGMSERWLRARIADGAEHQRYGNRILFTAEQVERLRASHAKAGDNQPVTTGRKRKRS